jgi:hypothetical protein
MALKRKKSADPYSRITPVCGRLKNIIVDIFSVESFKEKDGKPENNLLER